MFIGLYITQGTVATLLFLRIVIPGARIVSIAQGSAMVLLLIITTIYHVYLNKTFSGVLFHSVVSCSILKPHTTHSHRQQLANVVGDGRNDEAF